MSKYSVIETVVLCSVLYGCVDPYHITNVDSGVNYLVIDAFIDSGDKTGTVTLSRTIALDSTDLVMETGASVFAEVKDGVTAQFTETGKGEYTLGYIDIDEGNECRLHIKTSDGKEYYSQYVKAKTTPPMDSITWEAGEETFSVHVTTHDITGKSLYYRWRYESTFRYVSKYQSIVYYDPASKTVKYRYSSDTLLIDVCWKTSPSTSILIATTKNLSEDLITKFTLIEEEATSFKLKYKYSVLLKQYVMDEDEYNYWNQLKKNTESVGTIFDPQPSQISGNLYSSTDPDETVLGYFSVSSEEEQRVFIDGSDLPYDVYKSPYDACVRDTLKVAEFFIHPEAQLIINPVYNGAGALVAYTSSADGCIDCRIYVGGTNIEPDFWE